MYFVIHCLDHEEAGNRRVAALEDHRVYLDTAGINVLICGPLLAKDNGRALGSCFLVEAQSLEEVEAFNERDPMRQADVWRDIHIHPFDKRVDNWS